MNKNVDRVQTMCLQSVEEFIGTDSIYLQRKGPRKVLILMIPPPPLGFVHVVLVVHDVLCCVVLCCVVLCCVVLCCVVLCLCSGPIATRTT